MERRKMVSKDKKHGGRLKIKTLCTTNIYYSFFIH
jgi:hypothetical protein